MTETTLSSLREQADNFARDLPEELSRTWRMLKPAAHLGVLEEVIDELSVRLTTLGASAQAAEDDLGLYIVYEWLEEAKEFLLLLRDVYFEEKRGQLMVYEEQLDEEGFARLKSASRSRVEEAAESLLNSLREGPARPTQMAEKKKRWALQRSPWPIYIEQFAALQEQMKSLSNQANDLFLTADIYRRIQELFTTAFSEYQEYLSQLTTQLEQALAPQVEGQASPANKLLRVVSAHAGSAPTPTAAADFIERLEALTKGLPGSRDFIAATSGGRLLTRELNIQRATTNWVESELMNELQDFYLRRGQIESRCAVARSRAGSRSPSRPEKTDWSSPTRKLKNWPIRPSLRRCSNWPTASTARWRPSLR